MLFNCFFWDQEEAEVSFLMACMYCPINLTYLRVSQKSLENARKAAKGWMDSPSGGSFPNSSALNSLCLEPSSLPFSLVWNGRPNLSLRSSVHFPLFVWNTLDLHFTQMMANKLCSYLEFCIVHLKISQDLQVLSFMYYQDVFYFSPVFSHFLLQTMILKVLCEYRWLKLPSEVLFKKKCSMLVNRLAF